MCFGGRRRSSQKVDEEQAKAEAEAKAAKEAAAAEAERKRQEELEKERQAAASAEEQRRVQEEQRKRQAELAGAVIGEVDGAGRAVPSALMQRRSIRGARQGRRSLITSSGSGQGYYSRFL